MTTIPPPPGRLRPAALTDARAIAELHVRAWRWAYRGLVPDAHLAALSPDTREPMWRRTIRAPGPLPGALVWDHDGHIRGVTSYGTARDDDLGAGACGQLFTLYLDEELLGRGVGLALHDAALDAMRGAGLDRAVLWVLENNARGRTFYARHGWAPDGREKHAPFGDEQRLELRLSRRL